MLPGDLLSSFQYGIIHSVVYVNDRLTLDLDQWMNQIHFPRLNWVSLNSSVFVGLLIASFPFSVSGLQSIAETDRGVRSRIARTHEPIPRPA